MHNPETGGIQISPAIEHRCWFNKYGLGTIVDAVTESCSKDGFFAQSASGRLVLSRDGKEHLRAVFNQQLGENLGSPVSLGSLLTAAQESLTGITDRQTRLVTYSFVRLAKGELRKLYSQAYPSEVLNPELKGAARISAQSAGIDWQGISYDALETDLRAARESVPVADIRPASLQKLEKIEPDELEMAVKQGLVEATEELAGKVGFKIGRLIRRFQIFNQNLKEGFHQFKKEVRRKLVPIAIASTISLVSLGGAVVQFVRPQMQNQKNLVKRAESTIQLPQMPEHLSPTKIEIAPAPIAPQKMNLLIGEQAVFKFKEGSHELKVVTPEPEKKFGYNETECWGAYLADEEPTIFDAHYGRHRTETNELIDLAGLTASQNKEGDFLFIGKGGEERAFTLSHRMILKTGELTTLDPKTLLQMAIEQGMKLRLGQKVVILYYCAGDWIKEERDYTARAFDFYLEEDLSLAKTAVAGQAI